MKIFLLAGEESGALYARQIRCEIEASHPTAEFRGYADYGFKIEDLAVMGVGRVLLKLPYFLRVRRTMERAILEWRPDLVCTVDYPGMNLRLAAFAKAHGIRTVHVVCPQVWAWKKGRIPKIEAALDKLCCFFPFEPKLFKLGFAEFVGHPLVDEMQDLAAKGHKESAENVLAVLPGSRIGEIEKHMPMLLKVCTVLQHEIPHLKVVIPAANDRAHAVLQSHTKACAIQVVKGGAREVLESADAAVVASGTATLEAALAGCPTVLVYRVGWLFAFLARLLIKGIRHVGLINIVAEKAHRECPMPELLQENFTVDRTVQLLRPWLTDATANTAARQALTETIALLKSNGRAIHRIAQIVTE